LATNLGNAYYNQPQDVMGAIQTERQRSQTSGNLKATPQQTVSNQNGSIVIAPANPSLVYVPVYDPWAVYGAPLAIYPGFYYPPPPGVVLGAGLAIGCGIELELAYSRTADGDGTTGGLDGTAAPWFSTTRPTLRIAEQSQIMA
jgi:hypothetical protein